MADAVSTEAAPQDESARARALARQEILTKPSGSLGRLEEIGVWMAACQGQCPPLPLADPRVVIFAGDHGIVGAAQTSAYPSSVTAAMLGNFLAGGAAVNVLAQQQGASVRVLDISVDADPTGLPESVSRHKVRRSSGPLDRTDALTADEVSASLSAGAAAADEEIDSGADLLIAGDMGIGNTTAAAALVACDENRKTQAWRVTR